MSKLLERTAAELANPNGAGATVSRETPVFWLPLERVQDNPYQPRQHYDAEHILNLALSIKQLKKELPATKGLQQLPLARLGTLATDGEFDAIPRLLYGEPLELRKLVAGDTVAQLMFGHSRLRAFRLLRWGLGILIGKSARELVIDIELPDSYNQEFETRYAELMEPDQDYAAIPLQLGFALDLDMWRHAITENSQRKNINAIEEASAMARAQQEFGLTDEEAGRPFGYARSTAANKMRLLNLPAEVQRDIAAGKLTERHGRELLRLAADPEKLKETHKNAVKNGKTVAQLTQDVDWEAARIKEKQEKVRQLDAARSILERGWTPPGSTEPLPAGRVSDASYVFDTVDDHAILEAGLCGSHCECCTLTYRSYNDESMVRPDAEQAPRIGLGCTGGWDAINPKRGALRKLQSEAQIGPNEAERRAAYERAQKAAKVADLRREAQAKWDKALAKLDKAALWQDIRLWRLIFENYVYSYGSMAKKAQSITEFQQMIFDQLLESTRQYDRELSDYVPDPARLDKLITALTQPLDKPAQPGPGDSQKTGWEDGWHGAHETLYRKTTTENLADLDEYPTLGSRVLLRLIEECDDKAIRGQLWRRYNELGGVREVEED